jgi:hypothetical protein
MPLGGDEFRRTQQGNNNAYCLDNEVSWYDWTLIGRHREIHRFTRGMIAFRRAHPSLQEAFYTEADILPGARPCSTAWRGLASPAGRRDRILTPVDHFRHRPPLIASSRRLQTSVRLWNHLTHQAIFTPAPGGFRFGTRLALGSH